MTVTLRPVAASDLPFLQQVYASTREEELAPVPWSAEEKAAFLAMQFTAQHQYYQEHYPGASFQIIQDDGQPIGRLYVARWSEEIRVMDVALLPAHRNRGIGTALMRSILMEAAQTQKAVRLHVEPFNPALRLYQRLGFRRVEERGIYWFMEWRPPLPEVTQPKTAS